jgi:uncharacterized membrane protein (DUF2068 family)
MTGPESSPSVTPIPQGPDHAIVNIARGLRIVAVFEALKGALVLGAGFGLLSLVHHDLQAMADRLVRHSHLDPARHYPRIFIEAASHTDDSRLRSLAALAFLYAAVRLVEAYGLWHMRVWAEWFAIIAGSLFLPVEIYELFRRATWMRGLVLLTNLFIVAYLVYVRLWSRREFRSPNG